MSEDIPKIDSQISEIMLDSFRSSVEDTSNLFNYEEKKLIDQLHLTFLTRSYVVKVTLNRQEETVVFSPPSYFVRIESGSFIYNFLPEMTRFFENYSNLKENNWLSFEGKPVPFDIPFGALVDLLVGPNPTEPLELTIHFKELPFFFGPGPTLTARTQTHLLQSLKESSLIRAGESQFFKINFQKDDKDQILKFVTEQSLSNARFVINKFLKYNRKKVVPVRIFSQIDNFFSSRNAQQSQTLIEFLASEFPILEIKDSKPSPPYEQLSVYCFGIEVPWDVTFSCLEPTMMSLDGFIYLCLKW